MQEQVKSKPHNILKIQLADVIILRKRKNLPPCSVTDRLQSALLINNVDSLQE